MRSAEAAVPDIPRVGTTEPCAGTTPASPRTEMCFLRWEEHGAQEHSLSPPSLSTLSHQSTRTFGLARHVTLTTHVTNVR